MRTPELTSEIVCAVGSSLTVFLAPHSRIPEPKKNSIQWYFDSGGQWRPDISGIMPCTTPVMARSLTSAFNLPTAVFFSLQPSCLTHTGKPTGMAVSHCITWFQTQIIPTTCQIRYHSHCGIIVALDSSDYLEYCTVSRLRQIILVWTEKKTKKTTPVMVCACSALGVL
jgi:hypothetical protein